MIKNIVFDVGGVFVIWEPRVIFARYFNSPQAVEEFMKEVDFETINGNADRGFNISDQLKEIILKFPQYKEVFQSYDKDWLDTITGDIEGSYDMAMQLKRNGYKIYILSNWESDKFRVISKQKKLMENFDGYIISGDIGIVKPDLKIYKALLDKYNLKAQECVFFDDRPDNVEAAKKAGLAGLIFTTTDQAKKDLNTLGIKI
ncbi:MAG: HAD family phosphatase [Planctomycetaceae bacterium]|jgi:HAD superfamily hydrolase (TIGR01549 family)|nr:HAD family phosphatase [Planctomycetaceae bacterium]